MRDTIVAPVLATLLLIGADIMLFAGLVFAFWVLRLAAPVWPPPLQPRLPLGVTAANTVVLLGSSAAMVAATRALARGRSGAVARRLGLGALLGSLFLAVQGYEWTRLVGFGLTVSSGIFGALFYTLVGAHAVHLAAALAWLIATAIRAGRGRLPDSRADVVQACALYWHFVVALWPLLYVSVYLA
jgi:heme/copper-type cytochrome/quinol oxidase subunit 3